MLEIRAATASDAETILSFVRALAEYERQPEAVQVDAQRELRLERERRFRRGRDRSTDLGSAWRVARAAGVPTV